MTDRTTQAYAALNDLRSLLADMRDTTHPIHRPTGWGPTPEAIADAGRLHTLERHDALTQLARGIKPLGASPAPGDITVMQTRRDIDTDIADLEEAVRDRVAPQMRPAATTNRRIGAIVKLLPKVAAVDDLLTHVLSEAYRLRAKARWALGDSGEVRKLTARCPHCGAKSLRELADRGVVTCSNTACRCDDDTCPCGDEAAPRRHQWHAAQWHTITEGISA
jgi:nitrite reductase/ring-hydroxylating ferredoxin subunit